MGRKPLTDAEAAAWQRVIATVKPLVAKKPPASNTKSANTIKPFVAPPSHSPMIFSEPKTSMEEDALAFRRALEGHVSPAKPRLTSATPVKQAPQIAHPSDRGLDGHWDRRLAKGRIEPDMTIDLHGHNLSSAYAWLDQSLMLAIASGHRVILLITGKPRPRDSGRGAIRAAVTDWLAASRHAGSIAAVRGAHPRHGGQGALYLVLRRRS